MTVGLGVFNNIQRQIKNPGEAIKAWNSSEIERILWIYDDCFHRPETPGFREGDSRYQVDPKIKS